MRVRGSAIQGFTFRGFGVGVSGSGFSQFRVSGSGFRDSGSRAGVSCFGVSGSGFRVSVGGLGFRVRGSGFFGVSRLGFGVFEVRGFWCGVSGLGVSLSWVSGSGFRGSGFQV